MSSTVIAPAKMPGSRARGRWVFSAPPDTKAVAALCEMLHVPETVANLLMLRGHADAEQARQFLRPRLDQLHDASSMHGASEAVERLARACTDHETVMVHGDYDVDGICSTTIMIRVLRAFGAYGIPFIPHRVEDGYDLGKAGVNAAIAASASVVVTCDCGTSAVEPVAELCAAGIDVIVTDHHLPGGALPVCLAVLNPRQAGCEYPDKDLAAVGVAFKLAIMLARRLDKDDKFIWAMLDLVALATIADVAPLRGENRIMVRYGLRMLAETRNFGLRALLRSSGMDGKPLTAGRVGFTLAPRLNAAGRIKDALLGVKLLLAENDHDANAIARELEELNIHRQQIDRKVLDDAREMVVRLDLANTFGIVLAADEWHPGVIGIVASRLVEEFGRPVMLVALDGPDGKGSGRSIPGFDLHHALAQCSDLLLRFGGHKAAAGITIAREKVDEFARRFNAVASATLTPADLVPDLRVDLELPINCANSDLERLLHHFEPFGIGNPAPVLLARSVRLAGPPRIVGKDGLKLRLVTGTGEIEAIGWGMKDRMGEFDVGTPVDIAFRLERDEYRGESRLQARIADIRSHSVIDA
ncbi:MAG: single-stranded-DNA-specific exonuclease RecJ [Gemmatimonadota bacterium]|nr:single-stranded-DNA-specific exonuclease RecJ [Gemmatimonadota bacterium]